MRYAIIQTGGKQYRVTEGDVISVERLPLNENEAFVCLEVLLYQNDGELTFGTPFIAGFQVTGKILAHVRGDKIRVGKYKAKVRFRRMTGHRQSLSNVQITQIGKEQEKQNQEKVEVKTTPKGRKTAKKVA